MNKYLTFKDGKSDKFWSIEVTGTSFTVTYGKTGTEGQTSTKEFDTEEDCMKEAEKLVKEKLKKGYEDDAGQNLLISEFQDKRATTSTSARLRASSRWFWPRRPTPIKPSRTLGSLSFDNMVEGNMERPRPAAAVVFIKSLREVDIGGISVLFV